MWNVDHTTASGTSSCLYLGVLGWKISGGGGSPLFNEDAKVPQGGHFCHTKEIGVKMQIKTTVKQRFHPSH